MPRSGRTIHFALKIQTATVSDWNAVPQTTEITSLSLSNSQTLLTNFADARTFASLHVGVLNERTLSVTGHDIKKLFGLSMAGVYDVRLVVYDAVNSTGAGQLTFTWVNGRLKEGDAGIAASAFSQSAVNFVFTSVDGVTDPLTIVEA